MGLFSVPEHAADRTERVAGQQLNGQVIGALVAHRNDVLGLGGGQSLTNASRGLPPRADLWHSQLVGVAVLAREALGKAQFAIDGRSNDELFSAPWVGAGAVPNVQFGQRSVLSHVWLDAPPREFSAVLFKKFGFHARSAITVSAKTIAQLFTWARKYFQRAKNCAHLAEIEAIQRVENCKLQKYARKKYLPHVPHVPQMVPQMAPQTYATGWGLAIRSIATPDVAVVAAHGVAKTKPTDKRTTGEKLQAKKEQVKNSKQKSTCKLLQAEVKRWKK